MEKEEKLVIGAAGKVHHDAITVDIDPEHNPDVVHDLHDIPYPFKDNQFKLIEAHHVMEHLNDICTPMDELHRICHPEGVLYIEVPHHSSWCAKDPTHKIFYSAISFDGFCEGTSTWMHQKKYRMLKREITFHRSHRRFFLHKLFNRFPMEYERFWTYIFPAEHLKVWLQPIK